MANAGSSRNTDATPSEHWEEITPLADTDLMALSINGVEGAGTTAIDMMSSQQPHTKKPCKAIRCDTAGVLIVKTPRNLTRTVRFAAGETVPVQATDIVNAGSSGCVPITVYF